MTSDQIIDKIHDRIHKAVARVAEIGLQELKLSVSIPYPPASDPNESPHLRTGDLREGMSETVQDISITVTSSAPYSADLEFGTVKMAPRPFMRPNKQWNAKHFINLLKSNLKGNV